jgi:hypothetical protein
MIPIVGKDPICVDGCTGRWRYGQYAICVYVHYYGTYSMVYFIFSVNLVMLYINISIILSVSIFECFSFLIILI